ncbi:hypothetical protein CRE_21398 [Caenorhabditis remanei]|uniref:BTB domain-containing protein n=1 Tax=Caenorhabditis remanei TaxID=31234 RepID=E3MUQ7_CAERE|nr:hypothetical protein CRE_21398 [Caenorhabditis remanei]
MTKESNKKITNTPPESTIEKVLDMCKELLEKQENLEKSNMEIVEKLRSAEEKIDKISQKREEDTVEEKLNEETTNGIENSVIPTECSDEKSSQTLPMTGKCFVLKHVFTDVQDMEDEERCYGEEEEHFGVKWQLYLLKLGDHLGLYFECLKSLDDEKWLISSYAQFKLISKNGKCHSKVVSDTHGNADGNTEFVGYGASEFIEWDKMEEDFLEDDKLAVEIHVKIKKMTGIYKNDLKSFGDEMKSFSDVVLVVNEKKFFVSKLYLAGHSSYFNSLLMGDFQESKKSEIELTGIDADDFQNYLEILYGEQSIDEITVEGILLVADMYDTPLVLRKCEEFLLEKSKKTLRKKLQMSIRYNLNALKKQCISEIKSIDDIKSVIPGNIHDMDPSTKKSTLTRVASSFKVPIETNSPLEKDEAGCIFIDRDPKHFPLILNFLRDGVVELPDDKKEIREIRREANAYQLDYLVLLCERKGVY